MSCNTKGETLEKILSELGDKPVKDLHIDLISSPNKLKLAGGTN